MRPSMDGGEAVRVVVQARPLLAGEESAAVSLAPPHTVRLLRSGPSAHATGGAAATPLDEFGPYDAVCQPGADGPASVYGDHVAGLVASLFDGINATVMAYGQTASGKTYTMTGLGGLVAEDVFGKAAEKSTEKNVTVRVSFVEVYQDSIRDLVDAVPAGGHVGSRLGGRAGGGGGGGSAGSTGVVNVTVRTRRNGSVFLDGAREVPVRNAAQLLALVEAGARVRQTAATGMNATSSRSHSIVTITVEQEPFDGGSGSSGGPDAASSAAPGFLSAKLHLVDLAGSERTKRCTSAGGARFAEGVSINSGLLALAKVISALADNSSHVPYRESKLTRLLQDSLGGNSRSLVFACVSPTAASREETASTLRYAMRIKNIRNRPRVNVDPAAVENSDLRAALARARAQIAALTKENEQLRKTAPSHLLRALQQPHYRSAGGKEPLALSSPTSSPSPVVAKIDLQQPVPQLHLHSASASGSGRSLAGALSTAAPTAVGSGSSASASVARRQAGPHREGQSRQRVPRRSSNPNVRRTASDSSTASPPKPPMFSSGDGGARRTPTKPGPMRRNGAPLAKKCAGDDSGGPLRGSPAGTPTRSPRLNSVRRSLSDEVLSEVPVPRSPDVEPGSLMTRLAELESMLHDTTPLRARSDRSASSRGTSSETSPTHGDDALVTSPSAEVGVVALESAAARRGLPSLIEPDPSVPVEETRRSAADAKRQASAGAELEAKIRTRYQHKLSGLEKARDEALVEVEALNTKLATVDRLYVANLKSRDAEHQACIAELRSSLAEVQKKESERKRRLGDPSEQDRQRLLRRLAALKAANEGMEERLTEALGKSGESKSATSNLLRENRNLTKSEKSLKVRVQRLETIRSKQQEAIAEFTARERLAAIERHRNRHNRDRESPKSDSSTASASSGSSTLTPRQRQQFLERELLAVVQRRAGSIPKDDVQVQARHWAWIRSMDDARAVLRMCVVQLMEAREERSSGLECATEGRMVPLSEPGSSVDSGNDLRPSLNSRAKRRSSVGCGTARVPGASSSLPRSSSITLRCSSSAVSSPGGS